jgi:glycosyltransferase involved in cell wall biosynthesis
MRIGILSTMAGVPWGGSEELWAALGQAALRNGIAVSVCVSERSRPDHETFAALERAGADVFCRSDGRLHTRARQVSRVIEALNPATGSILREHLAALRSFFSTRPDILLITDGPSIPLLRTIETVQRHHLPRPYLILSQSNTGEIPRTDHRHRVKEFYAGSRSALFVSEDNLRATEQQLTQRLTNARVVRNPVNLNSVDPVPWPRLQSVSFASVARLKIQDKGQDIVFEVLSDSRWRRREWHLCLFGQGDDEMYLQELAAFYGLSDRIKFRGQCKNVRGVWAAHHALLLPSRLEGTPLAMVEAMLCGRPVIGTAVAGIPEWIRDGNTGFLADAPAASCVAATLERAWQHRSHWQEMGSGARTQALGMYDPAAGDTLLSIMLDAADARKASRISDRQSARLSHSR